MAKAKAGGDFKRSLPEPGNTLARCFSVIHLGTQDTSFNGKVTPKPQIKIGWELSTQLHSWKEGEPEAPFRVTKRYNFFISDKANLRKDIESWANRELTETEKTEGFDPVVMLNKPCQLTIAIEKNGEWEGPVVKAITPLMKEKKNAKGEIIQPAQKCPALYGEIIHFDFEEPTTFKNFVKLSKSEQELIRKSPEYKAKAKEIEPPQEKTATTSPSASGGADVAEEDEF